MSRLILSRLQKNRANANRCIACGKVGAHAEIADPECPSCKGAGMVRGPRTGRWILCECVRKFKPENELVKVGEEDDYVKVWASTTSERIPLEFPGDFVTQSQAAAEYSEKHPEFLVSVLLYEDGFTTIDRYHNGQLMKTDEVEGEYKFAAKLSWDQMKTASGEELYHGTDGNSVDTIRKEGLDGPGYSQDGKIWLTKYKDQAEGYARDSAEGQGSETFAIVVVDPLKVPKLTKDPEHEAIWVARRVPANAVIHIEIYDMAGQKLAAEKEAGPLSKALLPAALSLGLGLTPGAKEPKPPKPPVVQQLQQEAPAPVAQPLDPDDVTAALRAASKATHIPLPVLVALAHNETSYGANPAASIAASGGLLQMTPDALVEVNKVYGTDYIIEDMADPDVAALAAAQYLKILIKKFDKDLDAAIAAYNTGPAHVNRVLEKYGEVTPENLAAEGHNTASNYLAKAKARLGPKKYVGSLKKRGAMCECGHLISIHIHPPDFGCPHEKDGCGCKGATEKKTGSLSRLVTRRVAAKLSATMIDVLAHIKDGRPIFRFPGGFWIVEEPTSKNVWGAPLDAEGNSVWSTGIQTIRAMETRGLLQRTNKWPEEWRDERVITDQGKAALQGKMAREPMHGDSGAETGLRRRPDYDESDSYTVEMNDANSKTAGPLGNDVFPDGPSDFFEPVRDPHSDRANPEPNNRLLKLRERTGLNDQDLNELVKEQKDIDVTYNDVDQPGIPVGAAAKKGLPRGTRWFYHGTLETSVASIMKSGIRPSRNGDDSAEAYGVSGNVYVSTDSREAFEEAEVIREASDEETKSVVLKIDAQYPSIRGVKWELDPERLEFSDPEDVTSFRAKITIPPDAIVGTVEPPAETPEEELDTVPDEYVKIAEKFGFVRAPEMDDEHSMVFKKGKATLILQSQTFQYLEGDENDWRKGWQLLKKLEKTLKGKKAAAPTCECGHLKLQHMHSRGRCTGSPACPCEEFKEKVMTASEEKKPEEKPPYQGEDEDLPEEFFSDKPFAEQPKKERKMWVPRTMVSRLIAARRKKFVLPKAELLISSTDIKGGVKGPFIKTTGYWGADAEKISRHLDELGGPNQLTTDAELPGKMKQIYEKLKADPELIVEAHENPFMRGVLEITAKVASVKTAVDKIDAWVAKVAPEVLSSWEYEAIERGSSPADIYDFLDYVKSNYRAGNPEEAYEKLQRVAYELWKQKYQTSR
jgi:hypothetical protein